MSTAKQELPPNSAAAYVRMSTEHQQYSTENQADVIREYAAKRGYFLREGKLISRRQVPLVMDSLHSVDVDEEHDVAIVGVNDDHAAIAENVAIALQLRHAKCPEATRSTRPSPASHSLTITA